MSAKVTVLVGSCDRYAAAWPVFCRSLRKYWPDCLWPVKFVTNHLDPPCGEGLKIGGDRQWTENTKRALEKIETPVVLWMLEDFWLTNPVDTPSLKQFARHVSEGRADHIRLINSPSTKQAGTAPFDDRLFFIREDSPYRNSTCAGFWRREVFLSLLRAGESIWDFETKDPGRSKKYTFCCVYADDLVYLPHVLQTANREWSYSPIWRGKWTPAAKKYAEREGLAIDFSKDPCPR